MAHALLSPSSAHRWMTCPASVGMCRNIAHPPPSPYAVEGTLAHELAAALLLMDDDTLRDDYRLRGWATPRRIDAVRESIAAAGLDPVVIERDVTRYVEHVHSLGGTLTVERPIDIASVTGEVGACGTADAVVVDGDTLHVVDLKMGHEPVGAAMNEQLGIYAAALLSELPDITTVTLTIVQPRLDRVDTWTTARDLIELFACDVASAAAEALACLNEPQGHQVPSAQACRYCQAHGECRAAAKAAMEQVESDPARLSLEELGGAYAALKQVEQWAEAVRELVFRALSRGDHVPGYVLAPGREGPRKWADPARAERFLRRRIGLQGCTTRALKSPTQLEKEFGQEPWWPRAQELVTRAPGKMTVVREDSPRAHKERTDAGQYPDESQAEKKA